MRRAHTVILAGAAALLVGSAAVAATAKLHHMNVALPDGSVAQIEYVGDVAPKVTIAPPESRQVAMIDPFAQMDRVMASMEARHRAMMAQMAAMERAAAEAPQAPTEPGQELTAAGSAPQGYSMVSVSSNTDANGCTHTVETRSNGNGAPQVTKTSSGACGKADAPAQARPGNVARPAAPAQPAIPLSDRT